MTGENRYDHSAQRLISRELEEKIYLSAMSDMYKDALKKNIEIYECASKLTKSFTNIDQHSIVSDSRIIKILRYAISPSISQMKFGQFFGLNSIDVLENRKITGGSSLAILQKLAPEIANFINENIDSSRFFWRDDITKITDEAERYAKMWTCSISADQNAQTAYRNWRKERQENAIKQKLFSFEYNISEFKGVLSKLDDLRVGEFTTETRVKGRTRQKADVVCRSRRSGQLILIEAKAVGVELDATKRIKECCDKASDWRSASELGAPTVVSVIAGFFNETNIGNLQASDIHIMWEHDLNEMRKLL
jgi:hypothetical protein